jgi:hypothetical protein
MFKTILLNALTFGWHQLTVLRKEKEKELAQARDTLRRAQETHKTVMKAPPIMIPISNLVTSDTEYVNAIAEIRKNKAFQHLVFNVRQDMVDLIVAQKADSAVEIMGMLKGMDYFLVKLHEVGTAPAQRPVDIDSEVEYD